MPMKTLWLSLVAMTAMGAGVAGATPIISSSTGLSSPATTIDFSEILLDPETPLSDQYASFGLTFSGFVYNGCALCPITTPPSGAKPDIGNFVNESSLPPSPQSRIFFSVPVMGVAFQWASTTAPYTFTAYLGPSVVESFSVTVRTNSINGINGYGYYGFEGITLDQVRIDSGEDRNILIDHLEMGAQIPEPGTLLLLGAGLIGLGQLRRRR